MPPVLDRHGRPLRNLRLSVTDRCNLRCSYCMPEDDYAWLPRESVLTFEEVTRLAGIFVGLGVDKIRITGGEPLLRHELPVLVAQLAALPGLRELAMTSNGVLLAGLAPALRAAGLQRLTVSLDTLDASTFALLSRSPDHARVLDGIAAAGKAGFPALKLDTVLIAGVNDGEILDLLDYARSIGAELRFIEYMDVGGATHWRPDRVVTMRDLLARIAAGRGAARPLPRTDAAPAERFALPDGQVFGVIASVTQPFCGTCDRSRLTADGMWFRCLYAEHGTDLRAALRSGADDATLARIVTGAWQVRADRGAEERAALPERTPLAVPARLRANPHLEMHKRGG